MGKQLRRSVRRTRVHCAHDVEVVVGSELVVRPVRDRALCELSLQVGGKFFGAGPAGIVASPAVPIGDSLALTCLACCVDAKYDGIAAYAVLVMRRTRGLRALATHHRQLELPARTTGDVRPRATREMPSMKRTCGILACLIDLCAYVTWVLAVLVVQLVVDM